MKKMKTYREKEWTKMPVKKDTLSRLKIIVAQLRMKNYNELMEWFMKQIKQVGVKL